MRYLLAVVLCLAVVPLFGDTLYVDIYQIQAPDASGDSSQLVGDTVVVGGIVLVENGTLYAGAGEKFYIIDPAGGPWSSVLCYYSDSTAFPDFLRGDSVIIVGVVSEYSTGGVSNMTEILPLEIPTWRGAFPDLMPSASLITPGDIAVHDTTAEKWEGVYVRMESLTVVDTALDYGEWLVTDGVDTCTFDDDALPIKDWTSTYGRPPVGAYYTWAEGYIYDHYGKYKFENRDTLDFELFYPYMIWSFSRTPAMPTSTDAVAMVMSTTGGAGTESATIYYSTDDGATWNTVSMTEIEVDTFGGSVPAMSNGTEVRYYIEAVDSNGVYAYYPGGAPEYFEMYTVRDEGASIYDIQYSEIPGFPSPYSGYYITVKGIVTADSTSFGPSYFIQDPAMPYNGTPEWNGVLIYDGDYEYSDIRQGDSVEVYAYVKEYNGETEFSIDSLSYINVISSGNALPDPLLITCSDLPDDSSASEPYEGVLVRLENVVVDSLLDYGEWYVTDGTARCRIDDAAGYTYVPAVGDTLNITGIVRYTYGNYKIEPRGDYDIELVGIALSKDRRAGVTDIRLLSPSVSSGTVRFALDVASPGYGRVAVFDIMGRKVRTLVDGWITGGVFEWNGRDDDGRPVASGAYFVMMESKGYSKALKVVLVK